MPIIGKLYIDLKCFISLGKPVNRIMCVLGQVWGILQNQSISIVCLTFIRKMFGSRFIVLSTDQMMKTFPLNFIFFYSYNIKYSGENIYIGYKMIIGFTTSKTTKWPSISLTGQSLFLDHRVYPWREGKQYHGL